ncbi:MAG: hypothetical protein HFJ41_04670 [Clostridia bacterium]|nr:hypothetical protein [Clostridia bacterium]
MAKIVIITKTCPLCGYIYERMKKYEMVEKACLGLSYDNLEKPKNTKLVKKCKEDTVIKGDQDFEYVYRKSSPMEEYFGGNPTKNHHNCIGMFCPKCGIFLNDNICTKFEKKEIQ